MDFNKFIGWTVLGGIMWGAGLPLIGYFLGNMIPDIDRYLVPIILVIVAASLLPGLVHLMKQRRG